MVFHTRILTNMFPSNFPFAAKKARIKSYRLNICRIFYCRKKRFIYANHGDKHRFRANEITSYIKFDNDRFCVYNRKKQNFQGLR